MVGHSYGGVVITGAARDAGKVKSLVYVTALAPDEGESANDLVANYPLPIAKHFVPSGPPGSLIDDPRRSCVERGRGRAASTRPRRRSRLEAAATVGRS